MVSQASTKFAFRMLSLGESFVACLGMVEMMSEGGQSVNLISFPSSDKMVQTIILPDFNQSVSQLFNVSGGVIGVPGKALVTKGINRSMRAISLFTLQI